MNLGSVRAINSAKSDKEKIFVFSMDYNVTWLIRNEKSATEWKEP